jgi:hypothetical protein
MSFTLQHPESGLFWTSGIFGRVQLGTIPNVYTLEGAYIKNVNTGNYVNHVVDILHEGSEPEAFVFGDDGVISSQGKLVTSGTFLHFGDGEPTKWVKVEEVDDVPVTRAAALIEEALNAAACDCECGPDCECEECTCSQ